MKLEPRHVYGRRSLVLLPENEEESQLIDEHLGKRIPTHVEGHVTLADGYGQHYILLWAKADQTGAADAPADG